MLKTCSEGLTCPVTSVVCSYETLFRNISTQIAVLATLMLELFPQTSWGAQNPWFWALFETPKIASTQLQTTVENFLEVTWPCYRYSGLTSGYNLSNAVTLVIIRCLHHPLRNLVQNPKSASKKKASFKGRVFFWRWKNRFGPNRFQPDLCVVWAWELVRSKAYHLKMILHTHTMVIRPLENFLRTLEVEWVQNQGSQKVDKNMDFWLSDVVPTDSVGKEVYFMHYYTGSTWFC